MIVSVIHHPDWTRSRVADVLAHRGHDVVTVCPAAGDDVPDPAAVDGIVIGGGHIGVDQAGRHPYIAAELDFTARALAAGTPLLGLCLGAQMIAVAAGGVPVGPRPDGLTELGFYPLVPTPAGAGLFAGVSHVFQSHYESCLALPRDATLLASSPWFEVQAFQLGDRVYGFQFHLDARLDMVAGWWDHNVELHDRPGVQPLSRQLALSAEHEPAIQALAERLADRWPAPPVTP